MADNGAQPAAVPKGCLVASGVGVLIALIPVVLAALVIRSCQDSDWRFTTMVELIDGTDLCLRNLDDGPGYINSGCLQRSDVVGLPADIALGQCLELNQVLHGDLQFVSAVTCPE